jgi:hypothetical protein
MRITKPEQDSNPYLSITGELFYQLNDLFLSPIIKLIAYMNIDLRNDDDNLLENTSLSMFMMLQISWLFLYIVLLE